MARCKAESQALTQHRRAPATTLATEPSNPLRGNILVSPATTSVAAAGKSASAASPGCCDYCLGGCAHNLRCRDYFLQSRAPHQLQLQPPGEESPTSVFLVLIEFLFPIILNVKVSEPYGGRVPHEGRGPRRGHLPMTKK